MENRTFLKGALLGGIFGGIAALLLNGKSEKNLKDDVLKSYGVLSESSKEEIGKLKTGAKDFIEALRSEHQPQDHSSFLAGSVTGAILGVLAGLLIAPQAGHELREKLGEEYDEIYHKARLIVENIQQGNINFHEKLEDWKDTLDIIVDKFSSQASKIRQAPLTHLDHVVDWAALALRLYSEIQRKR